MLRFSFVLFIICVASIKGLSQKNPSTKASQLTGDLELHDPVMIKAGEKYYVIGTGISVKSSDDMLTIV